MGIIKIQIKAMNKDIYNEIKDYTNNQLLAGIALIVMDRLECSDIYIRLQQQLTKYKEEPKSTPQSLLIELQKIKYALQYAKEIENTYKELLIKRGVIKMRSEC